MPRRAWRDAAPTAPPGLQRLHAKYAWFSTTFQPRIYDMADENLRVFRRADLQQHFQHVVPEGLSFVIDLPDEVPGSHGANPKTGIKAELSRLVREFA